MIAKDNTRYQRIVLVTKWRLGGRAHRQIERQVKLCPLRCLVHKNLRTLFPYKPFNLILQRKNLSNFYSWIRLCQQSKHYILHGIACQRVKFGKESFLEPFYLFLKFLFFENDRFLYNLLRGIKRHKKDCKRKFFGNWHLNVFEWLKSYDFVFAAPTVDCRLVETLK